MFKISISKTLSNTNFFFTLFLKYKLTLKRVHNVHIIMPNKYFKCTTYFSYPKNPKMQKINLDHTKLHIGFFFIIFNNLIRHV